MLGKLFRIDGPGLLLVRVPDRRAVRRARPHAAVVALPSLTRLVANRERERLRWVFDQAFRLIQGAACALSVSLFLFAPELTPLGGGAPCSRRRCRLLRILALVPARAHRAPAVHPGCSRRSRLPGTVLTLALISSGSSSAAYFTLVPALRLARGRLGQSRRRRRHVHRGAHLALRLRPQRGQRRSGAREPHRPAAGGPAPWAPGSAIDGALHGVVALAAKLLARAGGGGWPGLSRWVSSRPTTWKRYLRCLFARPSGCGRHPRPRGWRQVREWRARVAVRRAS